jgi:anti-sigma regulatory factor (Ser/Thr protein kinase)
MAASEARAFLRTALPTWAQDGLGEITELLASELVTNAVMHGEAPITLSVDAHDAIRIEVTDQSSTEPILLSPGEVLDHGRGIFIVDRLATRWGSEPSDSGGKTVWFELDVAAATHQVPRQAESSFTQAANSSAPRLRSDFR